jgi:hypothetical protein
MLSKNLTNELFRGVEYQTCGVFCIKGLKFYAREISTPMLNILLFSFIEFCVALFSNNDIKCVL